MNLVLPPLPVLQLEPSYPILHPEWQLPSTWLQVSWVSWQLHCSWQLSPQVFPTQAVRTNTIPDYMHILASILTSTKHFDKSLFTLISLWRSNRHDFVTCTISNLWVTNAIFHGILDENKLDGVLLLRRNSPEKPQPCLLHVMTI